MTNLIIDIGNTALKAAFAQGTVVGAVERYCGEGVLDFILGKTAQQKPAVIAISTVRKFDDIFYNRLERECEKLIVLNDKTQLSLVNKYKTPQTLGADRLASAVAAKELFPGKNIIVFDFGTALTIDFITSSGEFLGGNISLGLRTRYMALNHYTQQLPLLDTPEEFDGIGGSTKDAINSGVILGLIFEVEGYIRQYPDHIHIFTGGDAIYFAKKLKSPIFVVYNLVLMGLAHVADYYEKKQILC